MDITLNPKASQISPMRTVRFSAPEEKAAQDMRQSQDKIEISHEGQQAAAETPDFDQEWKKLEDMLGSMTKDEFMSMVRNQLGEQKLDVNWNATVDPDGQIWCKSYFDSYVSQVMEFKDTAEGAIKDYYAGAYQEALNSPLGRDLPSQLNFIAAKYQCSWSDYFDASIPAGERQWTYTQVRAMLTGTGLRLNDPYALKDIHIPTNEETTKIAKQAADDKIHELVRRAKEASCMTDKG
mgnify:CR=1 FL=1